MATIGVRQLKNEAPAIVRRAEAGEVVFISRRGRPVAVVLPFDLDVESLILAKGDHFVRQREAALALLQAGEGTPLSQALEEADAIREASSKEVPLPINVMANIAAAIQAAESPSEARHRARSEIGDHSLLVLGESVSKMATGAASDVLHLTMRGESGTETVMLPAFSHTAAIAEAISRNPEWANLAVLEVQGGNLLDNIGEDVIVVIDPWTSGQVQIPGLLPRQEDTVPVIKERAHADERPVEADAVVMTTPQPVAAGELVHA